MAAPLLEALQQVRPDTFQTFKVTDIFLERDAVRLHLEHGTLVFLEPVAGQVTGALFEGTGEVLVVPPERAERHQLVKFTGSPILAESFSSAYFRFSDSSAAELLAQIRSGRGRPTHTPEVAARWEPVLGSLNRAHAVRLLMDFLDPGRPYFYAAIQGQRLGSFDVVVDDRRSEPVLVGQVRWREGRRYYDVWSSFARRGGVEPPLPAHVTVYRIDATLTPQRELEAVCELNLELPQPEPRALVFELSRFLSVAEVSEELAGASPQPLEFFQNATLSAEEARYRGSDVVLVILPSTGRSARTLRFRYRGQVVSDVGNGVLYVGARGSWYPSLGSASPAHYELRFRTPRSLELVATGTLRTSREDGDWKETVWATDVPVPVAGFNVGDYESREVSRGPVRVTAYANRQLEPQLAQAIRPLPSPPPPRRPPGRWGPATPSAAPAALQPAPPTVLLERVANDVANALGTFSDLFGPFPYPSLRVSQIPGSFGQGYPGLLYLSTFTFIQDIDQARMGLDERQRELFSLLTPAHETAHQWWGNWVRVPHYRDQWLAEGLAAYSALLHLERQPGGEAAVEEWLERYRADLEEKEEEGVPVEATGALTLGGRLESSRSRTGYVRLIYSKAPWVLHMLRELYRDPETGSDEVFLGVLRRLAQGGQPLTTAEFQRQLEAALPAYADVENTGRLDWFFQQWVYDTGIPRHRLRWQVRGSRKAGWQVEGTIEQSGVPDVFTTSVPVYAQTDAKLVRLGRVVVTGEKVNFRFPVKTKPSHVLLDPHHTVLSLPD
ncbi:MAG: hypothetical protein HY656_02425 [Acidobacteria bacterium]|nr:hypothetical protein [Acidobacteriota bacterium]